MSHSIDGASYSASSATGAGGADYRPRASGGHDQNEFRTPYSPAQDASFSSQPHWQNQTYGAYPAQNQFAAQNGSSHPSYSSGASYGSGAHASPYSAFSMQQHSVHHSRPGHLHLAGSQGYGHHPESGPPTPNSATMSHNNTPGGIGASPAYHSPSMAGMMPGMGHSHGAAAHQSYPSHYQASLVPQSGPGSGAGAPLGAPHLGSTGVSIEVCIT